LQRIREIGKEYDLNLSKYILSSINENINLLSKGYYRTKTKENSQEIILQRFVDGISEIQKRLQKKEFPQYREIALIIQEYFNHGRDNNYHQLDILKYQIKKWFDFH